MMLNKIMWGPRSILWARPRISQYHGNSPLPASAASRLIQNCALDEWSRNIRQSKQRYRMLAAEARASEPIKQHRCNDTLIVASSRPISSLHRSAASTLRRDSFLFRSLKMPHHFLQVVMYWERNAGICDQARRWGRSKCWWSCWRAS